MPARPPFSVFRFQVLFSRDGATAAGANNDVVDAGFSDVMGLEASIEVKAHPEGGRQRGVRQLLGRATYTNLVLKRGMTANLELWRWFTNVSRGVRPVARKSVTIELLDADTSVQAPRNVVARWRVSRAVPIKMKVSDLSGKGTELAIEELHLAHEGLEIDLSVGASGQGGR